VKTISHRELRNRISRVLRQVAAGRLIRITVNGLPVADLVPIRGTRRIFVPREEIATLFARAPLDRKFRHGLAGPAGATIEDL
jgi:prevent-host-death family protein